METKLKLYAGPSMKAKENEQKKIYGNLFKPTVTNHHMISKT